jgi:CubicO group peptidase (beta-lactamase class C family)
MNGEILTQPSTIDGRPLLARRQLLQLGMGAIAGALLAGPLDAAAPARADAAGPTSVTPQALEVVINPRPVYGGVWLPSTDGQYLRLDRGYDAFLREYGEMWGLGFRLSTLTSYVGAAGQVYYSAAYNPSNDGQYLRLGRTYDQLVAEFNDMYANGWRLGVLASYVQNGQVRYDAAYNPSSTGQYFWINRTYNDFLTDYGTMWNAGFRLTAMVTNVVGGQVYYSGYFHPSNDGQYLRLDRTYGQFLAEYGDMWGNNFRLGALSTYVKNGVVYYNATYNPGTGGNFVGLDKPYDDLLTTYGDMWGKGFRLATLVTEKVEALSPSRMAQGIKDRLSGNVTGFAAVVASKSARSSAVGGLRRTSADAPSRAWTATSRINIASVNKTITAVAALRAIAAKGLTVDDTIAGHLPTGWTLGTNVGAITFRELLTHTSGLRNASATDYASMKTTIAGTVSLANKTYQYQNQNFGLFRVLIPYLDGFSDTNVTDIDTATSDRYLKYVNDHIFVPSGIATVRAKPETSEPSLSYPFPAGSASGTGWGDWTKLCGGGCLNMSADEIATFLVKLRETGTLLSAGQVDTMVQNLFGWQNRGPVRHGQINDHNGLLIGGPTQLNTLACSFSSGVEAAVVINSAVGAGVNVRQSVIDAYSAAWVPYYG